MFREILRKICVEELGHQVIGEADDGERAIDLVATLAPELVLVDLNLPSLTGFEVIKAIRKKPPAVKVLVLSSHCDKYPFSQAKNPRGRGFGEKNTNSVAVLKTAISTV